MAIVDRVPASWVDEAECRDSALFVTSSYEPPELRRQRELAAKRICGECAARTECLEYALARARAAGDLGGLTEAERRALRASRTESAR